MSGAREGRRGGRGVGIWGGWREGISGATGTLDRARGVEGELDRDDDWYGGWTGEGSGAQRGGGGVRGGG